MELSIRTAMGKEYEVDHCVATRFGMDPVLYIEFIGKGMLEIVTVFSNKEETEIIYGLVEGEVKKTYKGYTTLGEAFIVPENGNLRIRLEALTEELGK